MSWVQLCLIVVDHITSKHSSLKHYFTIVEVRNLRAFDLCIGECLMDVQASEGLTRAGGSTSKMALSHDCRQEALVPCQMELSAGLLECPASTAAGFPRVE